MPILQMDTAKLTLHRFMCVHILAILHRCYNNYRTLGRFIEEARWTQDER